MADENIKLLTSLWNFSRKADPALFYSRLSDLNNFFRDAWSPTKLQEEQIKRLRSLYGNKTGYKELNNFLRQFAKESEAEQVDKDLFASLVNGINEGLDQFRSSRERINPNWVEYKGGKGKNADKYEAYLNQIIKQITNIATKISGSNAAIPAPSIDPLINIIKSYPAGANKKGRYEYSQAKGAYLEEFATWLIQMAGLSGLTTGNWMAIDSFFGEDKAKQIIEDSIGIIRNKQFSNNTKDNFITVSATGYGSEKDTAKKTKMNKDIQDWVNSVEQLNGLTVDQGRVIVNTNINSTDDFLNIIDTINGTSKSAGLQLTITLSPSLYKELQEAIISVQSKSNITRHLANSGRSIYKMNTSDRYYTQLKKFSQTKPVIQHSAVSQEEFETPNVIFANYVNYNLTHNITKTVYARNQYYFTLEGFSNLPDMMKKNKFYIRTEDVEISYATFLQNKFRTITPDLFSI